MADRGFDGADQLARIERSVQGLVDSLNGAPERDIEGIRPRLRATEANVRKLVQLVEDSKLHERVKALEDIVEALQIERKVLKAWTIGLAAGLGITSLTSLGSLALQLARLGAGVP